MMGKLATLRLLLALWLLLMCMPQLHAAEPATLPPIRIGLTPVFLDDQATFINQWRGYLENHLQRPVVFVQRGSYREITDMLIEEKLDFAWLCGYPYLRNRDRLQLVAVPLWRGKPLYQSYLIVPASDKKTQQLTDLRGKIFAYSDPDSNSGYLYPQYVLLQQRIKPVTLFAKSFFTWSHRKVVDAVATGLAQGGSVDGYVWETLALSHPELTSRTRIVSKSPEFGHPPFVASRAVSQLEIAAIQQVLLDMENSKDGSQLLNKLNLNGFIAGDNQLFDGIADMVKLVDGSKNAAPQGR